jgi:tetratricopeptide (TPR) repeat protein
VTLQPLQQNIPKGGTSVGVGELNGNTKGKSARLQEQARGALQSGDLPRAQELLLAALELSPSDPSVLNGLGVASMRQGKVDQASIWFEKSYKISQDRTFPAAHLGIIRWVQNNPDESYRYFDEAVSHGFSSPMTHYYLGILSIGKAEWKQAVEQLGLASPQRFRYRNLFLGLAYRGMGRDRQATQNFREFVKRNQVGLITVGY